MDPYPFWHGARVVIHHGSGVDSGKTGVIVHPREVKTDGRGIPTNIPGSYSPMNWAEEVAIRLDNGELTRMFKNRLSVEPVSKALPKKKTEAERMMDFFFPKRRGSYLMNLKSWGR